MKGRLMVVDDQEPILFAVQDYFTEHGWEVDCARELEEAEALADANKYDIVITDLHLSHFQGSEGLEIVSYIRAHGDAKVIVFTAYGNDDIEQAALERGAHAFVEKTTSISEIARLVTELTA